MGAPCKVHMEDVRHIFKYLKTHVRKVKYFILKGNMNIMSENVNIDWVIDYGKQKSTSWYMSNRPIEYLVFLKTIHSDPTFYKKQRINN
jgi:hypothetical protein